MEEHSIILFFKLCVISFIAMVVGIFQISFAFGLTVYKGYLMRKKYERGRPEKKEKTKSPLPLARKKRARKK